MAARVDMVSHDTGDNQLRNSPAGEGATGKLHTPTYCLSSPYTRARKITMQHFITDVISCCTTYLLSRYYLTGGIAQAPKRGDWRPHLNGGVQVQAAIPVQPGSKHRGQLASCAGPGGVHQDAAVFHQILVIPDPSPPARRRYWHQTRGPCCTAYVMRACTSLWATCPLGLDRAGDGRMRWACRGAAVHWGCCDSTGQAPT